MFSFISNRMGFLLNQSGHHHSHAHSHSLPSNSSSMVSSGHNHGQDSLAVRDTFVQTMGYLVQSVGVLIAAYIIRFKVKVYTSYFKLFNLVFKKLIVSYQYTGPFYLFFTGILIDVVTYYQ